jgi:hypothetical protein
MEQLEIKFFWPLTEQIPLDFDFTESEDFSRERFRREIVSVLNYTGEYAVTKAPVSMQTKPDYAGHWEVCGKHFQIHRETKPNWFHRVMNRLLINWEWKDKK